MIIKTLFKEKTIKGTKIHKFKVNNHNLKCCHCFYHHNFLLKAAEEIAVFPLHTSGDTRTCSVHTCTHTRCAGGVEWGNTNHLVPKQRLNQCRSKLSPRLYSPRSFNVSCLKTIALKSLFLGWWVLIYPCCPLVPAFEVAQDYSASSTWKGFAKLQLCEDLGVIHTKFLW